MNIRDFTPFLILTLVFSFTASSTQAELVDALYAIVNKKPIFKSDIDRFKELQPLRMKVDPLFANDPMSKLNPIPDLSIVNYISDEEIIAGKFPITDSDVEQEINGIQSNLHIEREAFKAAIAREGFKFEDYFKIMRVSLSKRQLIDREIRNKAAVSDDDLKAEYHRQQAGSKNFSGSFHLFLIKFPKKSYKTPALAKDDAYKAMDSIRGGKAIEEVSKKLSEEATPIQGGDLGFLSYSEMSVSLQKEVRKLGPNKVSDVVDDGDSFMIAKIGEIKADLDEGFEKEKDSLRGKLMEGAFQEQIKIWLELQKSTSFVKVNLKST